MAFTLLPADTPAPALGACPSLRGERAASRRVWHVCWRWRVTGSGSGRAGDAAWRGATTPRCRPAPRKRGRRRGTPWPQPLVSHYARYFRDGNRTAYEGLVAARQQRLTRAVVMALLPETRADQAPATGTRRSWLDEVDRRRLPALRTELLELGRAR